MKTDVVITVEIEHTPCGAKATFVLHVRLEKTLSRSVRAWSLIVIISEILIATDLMPPTHLVLLGASFVVVQ